MNGKTQYEQRWDMSVKKSIGVGRAHILSLKIFVSSIAAIKAPAKMQRSTAVFVSDEADELLSDGICGRFWPLFSSAVLRSLFCFGEGLTEFSERSEDLSVPILLFSAADVSEFSELSFDVLSEEASSCAGCEASLLGGSGALVPSEGAAVCSFCSGTVVSAFSVSSEEPSVCGPSDEVLPEVSLFVGG